MNEDTPNQHPKRKHPLKQAINLGVAASIAANAVSKEVEAAHHEPIKEIGAHELVLDEDTGGGDKIIEALKKGESLDLAAIPMTVDLAKHIVDNPDDFSEEVRQAALDFFHSEAQKAAGLELAKGRFNKDPLEDQPGDRGTDTTEHI